MTITPEQLDELSYRSKDDNLAKMIVGSEVRELIAEVRRLHGLMEQQVEIKQLLFSRAQKAGARVAELEESSGARQRIRLCEKLAKAEADRAALVAAIRGLKNSECWCEVGIGHPNFSSHAAYCEEARAALAKVQQTEPNPPPHDPYPYAEDGMRRPLCSPVCACGASEVTMCVCELEMHRQNAELEK